MSQKRVSRCRKGPIRNRLYNIVPKKLAGYCETQHYEIRIPTSRCLLLPASLGEIKMSSSSVRLISPQSNIQCAVPDGAMPLPRKPLTPWHLAHAKFQNDPPRRLRHDVERLGRHQRPCHDECDQFWQF